MVFSRVARFYGMSFQEIMELPIRVFWVMNANIVKISAENDMRALSVATASQSSEGVKDLQERLLREIEGSNEFSRTNAERDEEGFAELKSIVFR